MLVEEKRGERNVFLPSPVPLDFLTLVFLGQQQAKVVLVAVKNIIARTFFSLGCKRNFLSRNLEAKESDKKKKNLSLSVCVCVSLTICFDRIVHG